jgi:hypothetical protein
MSDLSTESPSAIKPLIDSRNRHGGPIQFRSALAPQTEGGLTEDKLRSRNPTKLQTCIRPVGSAGNP